MKKSFLLLGAVCILSLSSQAQGLRLGFKGGANYSNLSGDLGSDNVYDSKLSLHGGVMLNIPLIPGFLSIQPEILYSNKGYTFIDMPYTSRTVTYQNEGRVGYNYIDVPLLLHMKAGPLFFELGPQASYLMSVRKDYREKRAALGGILPTAYLDFTDNDMTGLSRYELGYAAGLGFESANGVMLGGRYTGDISRFVQDERYFDGRLDKARHSVFQLYLAFLLPGN